MSLENEFLKDLRDVLKKHNATLDVIHDNICSDSGEASLCFDIENVSCSNNIVDGVYYNVEVDAKWIDNLMRSV